MVRRAACLKPNNDTEVGLSSSRDRRKGILITPGTSMFDNFVEIASRIRENQRKTNGKNEFSNEEP
jgi:hypothetical protein